MKLKDIIQNLIEQYSAYDDNPTVLGELLKLSAIVEGLIMNGENVERELDDLANQIKDLSPVDVTEKLDEINQKIADLQTTVTEQTAQINTNKTSIAELDEDVTKNADNIHEQAERLAAAITRIGELSTQIDNLNKSKQDALTFDTAPTENSTNPVTSGGVFNALKNINPEIELDTTVTENSQNPVTSAGIYEFGETIREEVVQDLGPGISGAMDRISMAETNIETLTNETNALNEFKETQEVTNATHNAQIAANLEAVQNVQQQANTMETQIEGKQDKIEFVGDPLPKMDLTKAYEYVYNEKDHTYNFGLATTVAVENYLTYYIGLGIFQLGILASEPTGNTGKINRQIVNGYWQPSEDILSESGFQYLIGYDLAKQWYDTNTAKIAQNAKNITALDPLPKQIEALQSDVNDVLSDVTALETDKQDKLTFDTIPMEGSTNPVTSGGIEYALKNAGKNAPIYKKWLAGPIAGTVDNGRIKIPVPNLKPQQALQIVILDYEQKYKYTPIVIDLPYFNSNINKYTSGVILDMSTNPSTPIVVVPSAYGKIEVDDGNIYIPYNIYGIEIGSGLSNKIINLNDETFRFYICGYTT